MTLRSFLEDNSGGYSSMRLAFLVWTIGTFVVWTYASWIHGAIQPIDNSIVAMLGAITSGKIIQRYGEKTENPTNPPTP